MEWRITATDPPNKDDFGTETHILVLVTRGDGKFRTGVADNITLEKTKEIHWMEEVFDLREKDVLLKPINTPHAWCKIEWPPVREHFLKLVK
jgi:hypothetical protein